jgi:C4-dicarboxylate transporter DctQ subunit
MSALVQLWNRLEEAVIVFLLAAMTLVTFAYVVVNNLYTVFYYLADTFPSRADFFFAVGDYIIDIAQRMTWSNALTRALFGWLIFFGIAYGVRTGGHIGVDALVRLLPRRGQRVFGVIAVLACLLYAGLMLGGSLQWVQTLLNAGIGAEDLDDWGLLQGHIGMIVPIGFAMVLLRFIEILVRSLRNQQTGLGLADEATEALKMVEEHPAPEQRP